MPALSERRERDRHRRRTFLKRSQLAVGAFAFPQLLQAGDAPVNPEAGTPSAPKLHECGDYEPVERLTC